jgi:hypothetical protein
MSFGQKADPQYIIAGTVSGTQYTANLNGCIDTGATYSCNSACYFSFTGTFGASSLTGSYASTNTSSTQYCPARTGTINTTKQ